MNIAPDPNISWKNCVWRAAGVILAMLMLTNCAKMTDSVASDISCLGFGPIGWSRLDSDATIREIKQHNASWLALCAK